MADNRIYSLAIYHILKTYSDENNILSCPKISQLLASIYNIDVDRRTIISNIDSLINFGIDIETYSENRKGYYLRDRIFEDSEIHLLCNCIHSSHFIPEKASMDLIKKLTSQQSKYKSNFFSNSVYISNSRKTKNKELLLNVDILLDAIQKKKIIQTDYLTYDYNKNLITKRNKKYALHPYHIIQENDNLYLLCRSGNYLDLSYYRIDKMKNIIITQEDVKKTELPIDPYEYSKSKKFMFSGEIVSIYLRCHKRMLDDVIDQFGQNIVIHKDDKDENFFFTRIKSTQQGMLYFALQYLNFCEIIEPVSMREEMAKILSSKLELYK